MSELPISNVSRLKKHYEYIYIHKMTNIPIVNNKLKVATVGFTNWGVESKNESEVGILITPWFMNVVLLPKGDMQHKTQVGKSVNILFPEGEYLFLTQLDEDFGTYLTCSLFSPMFDFKTQKQAIDTAELVMQELLQTKEFKKDKEVVQLKKQRIKHKEIANKVYSRRAFLRGK
ncbi:Hydrogenase maturation factor HoxT/HybE [hydrothermal vent metagenome]|uniref:Hydrogenase maturation factor HoxT/HybE n=1 Tax=hydrothermal vent metagenome TaxID=652676 RepID=A0A1W1BZB4_9ZZZZ